MRMPCRYLPCKDLLAVRNARTLVGIRERELRERDTGRIADIQTRLLSKRGGFIDSEPE